ncbi:MAG: diguanylate cyclase [Deltaproteobacteria bacterium]|nr:diguanylate cyclase [Deltaproteobacteria bacterium]MDL1960743.1 diguanylate cyclase [Deltaproteobacteria bacterium]
MIDTETGLRNMEIFVEDLKRELVRVREHNYRTTLLLVKVDDRISADELSNEPSLEEVSNCLSEILRDNDSIYRIAENRFVAILPTTYEAGGETAALRLKRLISKKIAEHLHIPCSLSVGVLSIDPQEITDHTKLLDSLEKDLFRDQDCQKLDLDLAKRGPKKEKSRHVVISGIKSQELDVVASILSLKKDYEVHFTSSREKGLDDLRGQRKGVLIVDPDISLESRLEICKKIRSDRELHDTYIICLQNNLNLDTGIKNLAGLVDEVLPMDIGIDQIVRSVSAGFRIMDLKKELSKIPMLLGTIDFIRRASHQLNQPLQIIVGKIEILLINMEENGTATASLKEIRKQALRAADINQKIGRLVRHDISSKFRS